MIVKLHAGVQQGDYIRPWGHNVSPQQKWWKVIGVKDGVLHAVDRHGYRRDFIHRPGRKWATWEPGDSRQDGDVL
jgi:hypothetical protein